MLRHFLTTLFCLSVFYNAALAQQRYDPFQRKQFVDSLRNVNPEITQDELRNVVKEHFSDLLQKNRLPQMTEPANEPSIAPAHTNTFSVTVFNVVPDSLEYKALKALFLSTGGEYWANKTNWPYQNWPEASTITWQQFATWYGIDVENGDVNNLKLANNNLTGGLPHEMSFLTATDYLDLQNNQLESIAPGIGDMTKLGTIYLTNNRIQSLPSEIGQLTNLEYLLLESNPLDSLPAAIGGLSSLRYLFLNDNELQYLPATIGQLTSLEDLYLDNNQLRELPAEIGDLANLSTLSLGNNQLVTLPSTVGQLTSLQSLVLTKNMFTALPAEIGQIVSLYSLSLDNNEFSEFPAPIFNLTNLNFLYLDNNQLTVLPDSVNQLVNLMDLYLSGNQFSVFPEQVYSIPNLLVVNLDGNQLSQIPTSIDTMQGLWDLFINDNQLSSLPDEIANMPLLSLRIGGNPMPAIPPQIFEMSATLVDLDISRMNLTSLPAALADSMNIETLQVQGNKLDYGDLEPFFSAPAEPAFYYFDYLQQADIGTDTTIALPVGSALSVDLSIAGEHNKYYWEKHDRSSGRWILVDSTGGGLNYPVLNKPDEGLLRLRVINEWVTGLTIYSRPISVEIFYHNHVREEIILVEGITEPSQIDTLQVINGHKATQWIYYDGLQRVVQTIGQEQSPGKYDGIQAMDYDALVRQSVGYLPFTTYPPADTSFYPGTLAPGSLRPKALTHEQPYFYNNPPQAIASEDKYPFAQTVFEDSPLGRPVKQGAPGTTWNVDSGRTVNYAYEASHADQVLYWQMMANGTLQADSTYLNSELRKTSVTDENGNTSISYTDKLGRSILQKTLADDTTWLSTYVVYDQFNNVTLRIPPAAVELVTRQASYPKTLSAEDIALYCFTYRYDNENRLVEAKAPGVAPIYNVYDRWGRLVLSQTGNQRKTNQWSFTKYDI